MLRERLVARISDSSRTQCVEEVEDEAEDEVDENEGVSTFWIQLRIRLTVRAPEVALEATN